MRATSLRAAAVAALAAAFLTGATAPTATAAPVLTAELCTATPPFSTPIDGPAAALDEGPLAPNPAADPFTDPTTTVYQQYGYSGLTWINYDPGCAEGIVDSLSGGTAPSEDKTTRVLADLGLKLQTIIVGATVAVTRWAFDPATLATLTPIQQVAATAFGEHLYLPLVGLAGMGLGVWLMWKARGGAIAASAAAVGWALLLTTGATVAFTYPTQIAPAIDEAATSAVADTANYISGSGAQGQGLADSVGGSFTESLLYQTWLAGNFGRFAGTTADTYGPQLLAASTINRTEMDATEGDPTKLAELREAKAEQYDEVAQAVQDADPAAYEYLAGNRNGERVLFALIGLIATFMISGFTFLTAVLLVLALVIVRGVLAIFPLVVLAAIFPAFRHLAIKPLRYCAAVVVHGIIAGLIAAVLVNVAGDLLDPSNGISWFQSIFLVVLVVVAAYMFLFRSRRKNVEDAMERLGRRIGDSGRGQAPFVNDHSGAPSYGALSGRGYGDSPEVNDHHGSPIWKPSRRATAGGDYDSRTTPGYAGQTQPSRASRIAGAAVTGAATGAAAGAVAGLFTAGGATVGTIAVGAARSAGKAAVVAGATEAVGPTATALGATALGAATFTRTPTPEASELPAAETSAPAPAPGPSTPRTPESTWDVDAPASVYVPPADRIYMPDEEMPERAASARYARVTADGTADLSALDDGDVYRPDTTPGDLR